MIDTRTKIATPEQARAQAAANGWRAVRTYCDPMLPAHVDDLRALAGEGKLLLIIDTPEDAYLEARARCEIAASLSFAGAVTEGDGDFAAAAGAYDATEAEQGHRRRFFETVREKSGS
ncbi:MAG: hypothetical protein JNK48_07160 [Bryobacterales bacterium]|nr:hypothetical protein [Bryobacterales bacterium]